MLQAGNEATMNGSAQPASAAMPFEPRLQMDISAHVDRKFEQAVRLARVLGEVRLDSGRTLREALRLDQRISLWDVVETIMVLYRFPLPFVPEDGQAAWSRRMAYRMRPYRGLAARFRDYVRRPSRTAVGCAEWLAANRPVLITCFTQAFYPQVLQSVAESIAERDLGNVVVLHDGPPSQFLSSSRAVRVQSIWDHWDDGVARQHRSLRQHLLSLKREVLGTSQLSRLMGDISRQFGNIKVKNDLVWLFWREFVRLIPQWAVAKHILARHRPSLIISADDADPRCRIYSLLARAAGIPSLLVQQGLSSRDYPEWRFLSHDTVAAMGERSRRDLTAQGVDPERIVVTGHPGFDTFASTDPGVVADIRNDLGIPREHRLILFASQPSYVGAFDRPQKRTDMIKAVVNVATSMKGVTLVIKPHPGEKRKELAALVGKAEGVVLVDGTVDIAPLIKACDVFITFFSTTALQALYVGKPVITIDVPGSGGGRLYTDSHATWVARSCEDLRRHLTNLFSPQREEFQSTRKEARQRFLREMAYQPDGRAKERVLQVIVDLLGGQDGLAVSSARIAFLGSRHLFEFET